MHIEKFEKAKGAIIEKKYIQFFEIVFFFKEVENVGDSDTKRVTVSAVLRVRS